MKKYLALIGFIAIFSCSTEPEPTITPVSCSPTSVTFFDEAFTRLTYEPDGSGSQQLSMVSVYDGTDSSYFYTYTYNTRLETISQTEDGETTIYNAIYDSDKLIKLSVEDAPGEVSSEIRFVYNGSNMSSADIWAKASDSKLYQIAHSSLTYDGDGNLILAEINIDIVALLTIAFGGAPDAAYAPVIASSIGYEYGQEDAPNPIYGSYYVENPDMTFMKNLPVSIVLKDENGIVTESEAYTITLDENGYPTKSVSGAKYLEAIYDCK